MKMQHTPESNVLLESCKDQRGYDCSDSGYSGFFLSPHDTTQLDSTKPASSGEYDEMTKENQRLPPSPREKTKEPLRFQARDTRGNQQQQPLGWTETPKRQSSLHLRLQMCRPLMAAENPRLPRNTATATTEAARSPSCNPRTKTSAGIGAEHWVSVSFDSLDALSDSFKLDTDVQQMSRKRRLFAQMRTSTRQDDKHILRTISLLDADISLSSSIRAAAESQVCTNVLTSSAQEISQSPIIVGNDLHEQSDVLSTPALSHTPKYVRYAQSLTVLNQDGSVIIGLSLGCTSSCVFLCLQPLDQVRV